MFRNHWGVCENEVLIQQVGASLTYRPWRVLCPLNTCTLSRGGGSDDSMEMQTANTTPW